MKIEFSREIKIDHIDNKMIEKTIEANAEECHLLARRFDIVGVQSLSATIKIARQSDKITFHVTGQVDAKITQESVVSAQKFESHIHNDIDAWFIDNARVTSFKKEKERRDNESDGEEFEMTAEKDDPDPIQNGAIDVGELAAQFFGLALSDYPHAPDEEQGAGDYIEVNAQDAKLNPFAKLAELKTKK